MPAYHSFPSYDCLIYRGFHLLVVTGSSYSRSSNSIQMMTRVSLRKPGQVVSSTPMLRLFAMLCGLGCGLMVSAQNDTVPVNSINAAYNRQMAATGDLYYGREHTGYPQKLIGTPYYSSNEWQKGTVVFNGRLYEGVNLKYDLITDQLVVLHPNNFFALTLFPEKVTSFTIGNDQFIYVPANNAAGIRQAGFYQQLVTGRLTILAKRSKRIEEATSTGELERTVVESQSYWALKNGTAYPIGGEESVLALVDEHARQIRTTLREKGIRFRKAKELALLEIATIYNQSAD